MSAEAHAKSVIAPNTSLTRIRLELARTAGFPTGSTWHGYEFIAPLSEDGQIDGKTWSKLKELCHVTRFWGDNSLERGQFVHRGHVWCFQYSGNAKGESEPFFKLDRHRFTPGGYVTITEPDGKQHPFRVVAMTPALLAD